MADSPPPGRAPPGVDSSATLHTLSSSDDDRERSPSPPPFRPLFSTHGPAAREPDRGAGVPASAMAPHVNVIVHPGAQVRDVNINVHTGPYAAPGGSIILSTADGSARRAAFSTGATVDVRPGCARDIASEPLAHEGGRAAKVPANAFLMMKQGAARQHERGDKVRPFLLIFLPCPSCIFLSVVLSFATTVRKAVDS